MGFSFPLVGLPALFFAGRLRVDADVVGFSSNSGGISLTGGVSEGGI
jgi:hypothetical protein